MLGRSGSRSLPALALTLLAPAQSMLPLEVGSRWTYQVSDSKLEEPYEETAWVWGEVPLPVRGTGSQLVRQTGQVVTFEYWRVDKRGVFRHDSLVYEQMRGADVGYENMLPLPVGIETRWEWTIEGDTKEGEEPADTRITVRAELMAPSVEITVPLGTFDATHVRIRSKCPRWLDPKVRDLWFVRGKGIARERTTQGQHVVVKELAGFEPGRAAAPEVDRDAVARDWLKTQPDWQDGEITLSWALPSTVQCYLHGAFALAQNGERHTCVWVVGTEVTAFAAGDRAFWNERFREAAAIGWQARKAAPVPGQPDVGHDDDTWALHALTELALRLHAKGSGHTGVQAVSSSSSVSVGAGPIECETEIEAAATDRAGKPVRLTAQMKARGDKLEQVGFGGG